MATIVDLLDSLSLGQGAIVGAVISALLATAFATLVASRPTRWVLGLVTPLAVAFGLYWTPVWSGNDSSEYAAWAPLFIGPWFLAGAGASSIVLLIMRGRAAR